MKDLHTLVPSQVNLEINFNSNPVKALNPLVLAFVAGVRKGRGIGDAVADLWEGPGDPPTPYFRSNRGPSPFFHLPDLWRLLVFLLPLVHSLVCCSCYLTVVCSVIICSLLSQLPGNTNLSQKLRYLSSTCDVRKRRSVHEQSQEWTSVGRKKHNSFDLLSCTLLYSEYRLHKIAVWFTVLAKRRKEFNKCLLFNSFRIYNLLDSFKFRFLGMDVLQRRVKNVIISILRWKSGGKLVFCTRNPA